MNFVFRYRRVFLVNYGAEVCKTRFKFGAKRYKTRFKFGAEYYKTRLIFGVKVFTKQVFII